MVVKHKLNGHFVGSRALFDPKYVPPEILHREKEERGLLSLLDDSISDNFSLNILYQGIEGIGKKAIINKVLKDLSLNNEAENHIYKISIDCKEKTIDELLVSLLVESNKYSNIQLDPNSLINSTTSQLWSIFKLMNKKIQNKLFIIFNNSESLKLKTFKKFLHFGKESKITLISTINKVLNPSSLELSSEFDMKKKLNYFSYKELLNIFKQRASLSFPHKIDSEIIEFITDLIFEHFVPIPGKGIEILRELYPTLKNQHTAGHSELVRVFQEQFDTFQISDEFNMLSYISELDILVLLFLDNLSDYFINNSKFYISRNNLKELYEISCESLEYEKLPKEFIKLTNIFERIGLLSGSKNNILKENPSKAHNSLELDRYFMAINPNHLKAMVDALFNNTA